MEAGTLKPTRRQRGQAYKAQMLDVLHRTVLDWDSESNVYGLSQEEVELVQEELGSQLYNWAVRITPTNVEWENE